MKVLEDAMKIGTKGVVYNVFFFLTTKQFYLQCSKLFPLGLEPRTPLFL